MNIRHSIVILILLNLASCTRVPNAKTLAGEWHQDAEYFQSKTLIDRFAEIENLEDYELYITTGGLAATRLVGKGPDEKRVYWRSPVSFSTDPTGNDFVTFNSYEGEVITAAASFEGKHLILKIGKRRIGFLKERASNLRDKEYMP